MKRKTAVRVGVAVAVLVVLGFIGRAQMLKMRARFEGRHPELDVMKERPSDVALKYESFDATNPEGTRLAGWWLPAQSPSGSIVMVHGFGQNKGAMLGRAAIVGWRRFQRRAHRSPGEGRERRRPRGHRAWRGVRRAGGGRRPPCQPAAHRSSVRRIRVLTRSAGRAVRSCPGAATVCRDHRRGTAVFVERRAAAPDRASLGAGVARGRSTRDLYGAPRPPDSCCSLATRILRFPTHRRGRSWQGIVTPQAVSRHSPTRATASSGRRRARSIETPSRVSWPVR